MVGAVVEHVRHGLEIFAEEDFEVVASVEHGVNEVVVRHDANIRIGQGNHTGDGRRNNVDRIVVVIDAGVRSVNLSGGAFHHVVEGEGPVDRSELSPNVNRIRNHREVSDVAHRSDVELLEASIVSVGVLQVGAVVTQSGEELHFHIDAFR